MIPSQGAPAPSEGFSLHTHHTTIMDSKTYRAQANLLMLQTCPTWYEHMHQVEQAMLRSDEEWAIRKDYGWTGEEDGEYGPNPLEPGEVISSNEWEETLGLSFPEDMNQADQYLLALMEVIGENKHDLVLLAQKIALFSADYLSNTAQPGIGVIQGQLRRAYWNNLKFAPAVS